jgi:iron-sulfur cluster insertion protein
MTTTHEPSGTGEQPGGEEFPLQLTPKASEKIVEALAEESKLTGKQFLGVRVSVIGGGCSGFQYGLDFVEAADAEAEDLVTTQSGAKVFCDRFSASYLYGTTLDYLETL